jgi:hypothetical protein
VRSPARPPNYKISSWGAKPNDTLSRTSTEQPRSLAPTKTRRETTQHTYHAPLTASPSAEEKKHSYNPENVEQNGISLDARQGHTIPG